MSSADKKVTVGNIRAFYRKLASKFMPLTTPQELRAAMGLGDTLGPLAVEYGGTGSDNGAGALDELEATNYNKGLFYIDGTASTEVLLPRYSPVSGYTFTFIEQYKRSLVRNWNNAIDENIGIIATPTCGFNNANSSAKTLAVFFDVVTEDGALTSSVCEVSGSPTFGSNMANAHDHYTSPAKRIDGGWEWYTLMVQRSSGTNYTVNGTATSVGHSVLVRIVYTDDGVGTATFAGMANMTAISGFKTFGWSGTLIEVDGDFFLTVGYDSSSYLYTGLFRITSDLAATKITSVGGTSLTGLLNSGGHRYSPAYLQYDEELDLVILYDRYYTKGTMFAFSPDYSRVHGMYTLSSLGSYIDGYEGGFVTHSGNPIALGGLMFYHLVDNFDGYSEGYPKGFNMKRSYVDRETLQVVTQTTCIPYVRGKSSIEEGYMYPYQGNEPYANAVMFDGGEWVLNNYYYTNKQIPFVVSPDLAASCCMVDTEYAAFADIPCMRQVGRSVVGVSCNSHYINSSSNYYTAFTIAKAGAAEKGTWINA